MRTSEQTDKIDAAIGRVQTKLELLRRNKDVAVEGKTSKFASRYLTISALWAAVREPLAAERIVVQQLAHFDEHGGERCLTRLALDGQCIVSSVPVKAREGMQNYAGAFASARRIGLAAAIGLFTADDADEKHGYETERARNAPARRNAAPVGLADAKERIRAAETTEAVEGEARLARGAFPKGDESKAVEGALAAWYLAELATVTGPEHGERLVALRASLTAVKPQTQGGSLHAATADAERRVKGGPS